MIIDINMIFIVLYYKVCVTMNFIFCNVQIRALGGTCDVAHLRHSSLYKKFMRKKNIAKIHCYNWSTTNLIICHAVLYLSYFDRNSKLLTIKYNMKK